MAISRRDYFFHGAASAALVALGGAAGPASNALTSPTEVPPPAKGPPEALGRRHSIKMYFNHADLDLLFLILVSGARYGAAAMGECLVAASSIDEADPESWVRAWVNQGERIEKRANEALQKGHKASAREAFLRAFNYWRWAEHLMAPGEPALLDTWRRARRNFQRGAALLQPAIEVIEVPFDGKSLPGYFLRAPGKGRKPTLLMFGGGETTCEDMYFWAGGAGVERGYNVVFVDLPGQGGAFRLHGFLFAPDTERAVCAIVDYVLQREDVDAERLAIHGLSFGGYMVTRAVVHEKRIKACIANAPIYDAYDLFRGVTWEKTVSGKPHPVTLRLLSRIQLTSGVDSPAAFIEKMRQFTFRGQVGEISCPTLCLVGDAEPAGLKEHAREFYEQLTAPKQWIFFDRASGADAHCQANNISLQQAVAFDWLDEIWDQNRKKNRTSHW